MKSSTYKLIFVILAALLGLSPQTASAAIVTPTDLDQLNLGAKIIGPVGPTVDTTFVNMSGDGISDLISSVSCPAGFSTCIPSENSSGTLYTYVHQVTPGIDLPNDPPFPSPAITLPLDNTTEFRLNFAAEGFTGTAGFSFSQATSALGNENIVIEQLNDRSLVWSLPESSGWNTGETITFFWQTTQPPVGPSGVYSIANVDQTGTAAGPLPTPVVTVPESTVPFPLFIAGFVLLTGHRSLTQRL